ncbi:hypothetical protein TanjilG_32958 [Lupinus angustifolius]|uniref:Protein kinase domain-containing protein n=2 Tax=Lupinus angustifolius TaxID=3871 RepID=A0A4P1RNS1_LUPAN|nr:hypothetical protein TanjilG_32958 [Lupinus angustifolius]
MELSGTIDIDTLLELPNLISFSVINNDFEGPMPEFKRIASLRALFLTNNKFSGHIPDDGFEGMRRLKKVFLAENGFNGHIPRSLAKLPALLDVDLHGNNFQGIIPEFQQRHFRVFNLVNNLLVGPIPEGLSNVDPSSYAGNKGLCGKPLSQPCIRNTKPNFMLPHEEKEIRKQHTLFTAIMVVALTVLASILTLIFIHFHRRKRAQHSTVDEAQVKSYRSNSTVSSESKSILVAAGKSKKSNGDEDFSFVRKDGKEFDLQDLLKASAEVLGSGSFGSTYKAMMLSGPIVVKRFKQMSNVGKHQFFDHMKRLGRLRHTNILPLIAFYYGKEEKLLVYEFAENSSLASHLHGRCGSKLDWPTRLKIIKGVARGLAHLYEEFPDQKLPHGHLKSSNVVLDRSFEPRLTEYGLVAVMNKKHVQQFMCSSKSPEVSQYEKPSEKTDAWCLGILILELLTGKFPASYVRHGKGASEELETWVKAIVKEGWSGGDVIDKELLVEKNGEGQMLKLLRIGMSCCEWSLENRMDWKEAMVKIQELNVTDHDGNACSGVTSKKY